MGALSVAKGVSLAPRKVGVVAALVRGRTVADALVILEHTPRRASTAVAKAIKSAAANAEHNHGYKPATLQITEISVTAGPRLKRFMPVARGMAHPYQKKTSHIRVVVDGDKREVKPKKEEA
jgi:large subunit ribosomal protein L22